MEITQRSVSRNTKNPTISDHPGRAFKGHLGGVEFAFNGYSSETWGRNEEPLEGWLDLNTTKSSSFNIVAPPVSLGFSRRVGLVTALGISFNNYFFDGNNSITVDENGNVEPSYPADGITYEKSKLATVYGILPVMLEVQIPVSHSRTINLGAGMIGAIKFGSHTKTVYRDDEKQKDKNHDDFNLNLLRYGLTARAGYEMVQVYGTCYLSPMFENNRGPVLYPYEVGIALTFND
ncbi:MAG: outer membrane beta-barrel protein [Bacteroidales bacterium]|nr:outer membrane beta-barrel protein [Bacteroidales bacterium]